MSACNFAYEQSDIPLGVTLAEWREGRSVAHVSPWGRFKARRRRYRNSSLWGVV